MKKHLIMGTAGHVDHGKTTLIKSLTGYDCDTHKQEKSRGITINLGFTHIDLSDGNSVGVIDVPGHKDFVNTMISGVSGIDFVMLVIAADDGVMPQTKEHLLIMQHLGIKHGFVALTKSDLVDEELLELAKLEISEFLEGTFLQNCEIIPVNKSDIATQENIKKEILKQTQMIPTRRESQLFRLYIDRIFTVKGFGTIVNGSVLSGKYQIDENVRLLPQAKEIRVRRIEKHGNPATEISAGDRASLNLVGVQKSELNKGSVLLSENIKPTTLVDAKIRLFADNIKFNLWSQSIFLFATIRQMVKIHLLNKDKLQSGEEGIIQIYFEQPIVTLIGDRFILRNSSGDQTIGAGEIIDPYPLHHRRRHKKDVEIVEKIAEGEQIQLVISEVKKSINPLKLDEISQKLNIPADKIKEILPEGKSQLYICNSEDELIVLPLAKGRKIRKEIITKIKEYNQKNPLLPNGLTFKELLGVFHTDEILTIHKKTLTAFLSEIEHDKIIKKYEDTWIDFKHKIEIEEKTQKLIEQITTLIKNHKDYFISIDAISGAISNHSDKDIRDVISYLIQQKIIVNNQKEVIHLDSLIKVHKKLSQFFEENETITAAQFRDILDTNRKNAVALLEFLDQKGMTIRLGNNRKPSKIFWSQNFFTK